MLEPVERVQFVVSEKFISAYLHQIAPVIMYLLVNTLHEKRVIESQNKKNFAARADCNLHSCYNIALVLHEKCTRFQPKKYR